MSELSPAAKAVMIAATNGNANVVNDPVYRQCIAAALRAAADQVVPATEVMPQQDLESRREAMVWGMVNQTQVTRQQLLALATELENHQ